MEDVSDLQIEGTAPLNLNSNTSPDNKSPVHYDKTE